MIVFDIDLDFFMDKQIGAEADLSLHRRFKWNNNIHQWKSLDSFMRQFQTAIHPSAEFHIVENHQDILEYWTQNIRKGKLTTPFTIVHFDAHIDLYVGRRQDDYYESLSPKKVLNNPSIFKKVAEEDNFLWWPIRFGWVQRILWVKPPSLPLYFLGKKELSPLFQPSFRDLKIRQIDKRMQAILKEEDVTHPLLLSPSHKQEYEELEKQLRYLKYKKPFVCTRFNKKWIMSLHYLEDLSFPKNSVYFVSLAHSPRYVPQKADAVFNDFMKKYILPQRNKKNFQ